MPVLRNGDGGPWVSQVQQKLKNQRFYLGPVDGSFGSSTETAVRAFQRARTLPVSGMIDDATSLALGTTFPTGQVEDPSPESASLLFPWSRIDQVSVNLPFVIKGLTGADLRDKPMFVMALATIRAETGNFTPRSEAPSKFNTSPGGRPFDLYDSRHDLGNQGPPDGERFKGRGYIQLTGRANYRDIGMRIGLGGRLEVDPALANDPEIAGRILSAFMKRAEAGIRAALDRKDFAAARKIVNGGTHGLNSFRNCYLRGEEVYSDSLRLA